MLKITTQLSITTLSTKTTLPVTFTLLLVLVFTISCGKKHFEIKPYGEAVAIPELKAPTRSYWPTKSWKTANPESQGMDPAKLQEMQNYAFTLTGREEEREGIRTDGVVIIRNGFLVYENYARGYNPETKHLIWSIAKSYTNAIAGIAVRKGFVELDGEVARDVPELNRTEDHKKITYRHLLNMSSGLSANEGYESSPLNSSVIAMLYTRGRGNMGLFSAELPIRSEPGSVVYYSSSDTNLLSHALRNALGQEVYNNLPKKELFEPLGISDTTWEQDGSGVYVGSSYIYTTPRDLAKFGFLYLNNGTWENRRILPPGWVQFSRTPAPAYKTSPHYDGLEDYNYTAHWYANTGIPDVGIPKPLPDAPDDTFYGSGHWGQRLYIIPSLDLVVVRVGDDRDKKQFNDNRFLKYIVESVKQ